MRTARARLADGTVTKGKSPTMTGLPAVVDAPRAEVEPDHDDETRSTRRWSRFALASLHDSTPRGGGTMTLHRQMLQMLGLLRLQRRVAAVAGVMLAASCGESQTSQPDGSMDPNNIALVDRIVFSKTTSSTLSANLYVLAPDHSTPTQFTFFTDNIDNQFFAFTPGGWAIYQHGTAIMAVPVQNAALETTVVLADATLYARPVAVSSDDRVVFQVASEIRSVRADGTEPKTLATAAVSFHGITTNDRVIFSDLYVLYAVRVNAGAPSEAIKIDESMNAYYGHEVVISGQLVAFAKADVLGLIDLSVDPPRRTPLASGGLFSTPNLRGSSVFYNWRPDASQWWDLWVIQSDGTGKLQLTNDVGPGEWFRSVTGDGRVIYERTDVGSDLHSVKLDGTGHIEIGPKPASFVALTAGDHVVYSDGYLRGPVHSVKVDGSDPRLLGDGEIFATTDAGYVVFKTSQSLTQNTSVSVLSGEQVQLENVFQSKAGVTSNGRLILGGIPSGGGVQLYSISPSGAARSWVSTSKPESPGGFDTLVRVVP